MNWLDDSDPINDRNSGHYGAPDPSFITPGLDDTKGEYVDWVDDGPAGYGSVWKSTSASGALLHDDDDAPCSHRLISTQFETEMR